MHDRPIHGPADALWPRRARPIPSRRAGRRPGEEPRRTTLEVLVEPHAGGACVRLRGVFDGHTYGAFLDALTDLLDRRATGIAVDLAGVTHMSSAGAAACVAAAGVADAAGGAVALCAPSPPVHCLLTMLGIDAVAPCFASLDAGLAWLAAR